MAARRSTEIAAGPFGGGESLANDFQQHPAKARVATGPNCCVTLH